MAKLTGKFRHRVETVGFIFSHKVMVLQVEKNVPEGAPDNFGLPSHLAYTDYFDATPEDLQELMRMGSIK